MRLPINTVARSATYQAWPYQKAAGLYPGQAKTDRRNAFIIANTSRTMPHTLRADDRNSEVFSALKMLSGFDDDISRDCTTTVNRLRSLLTQIHPSLERVFAGSTRTRDPILDLLIHYTGPTGLKKGWSYPGSGVVIEEKPPQPGRAGRQHFRGTSGTNCYCSRNRGSRACYTAASSQH